MIERRDFNRPPKREWHGVHKPWRYRPDAFRWLGQYIVGINIYPIAGEMRAWMLQRGKLALALDESPKAEGGCTNPYTFSGLSLAMLMGGVVNSFHDFTTSQSPDCDSVDAEIERIRLYNEIILYSARICEVAIKQLLYCTQMTSSKYKRMSLGLLLEQPCPSCKKESGKDPHTISLIGSLAHPFNLCLEFDHCAMDHMSLVNKLRNSQTAHSDIQRFSVRSAKESKTQLLTDGDEVLSGFLHMLWHFEKLEERMSRDLAEKGDAINHLKKNGLRAEDCNFNLIPGKRFVYQSKGQDTGDLKAV